MRRAAVACGRRLSAIARKMKDESGSRVSCSSLPLASLLLPFWSARCTFQRRFISGRSGAEEALDKRQRNPHHDGEGAETTAAWRRSRRLPPPAAAGGKRKKKKRQNISFSYLLCASFHQLEIGTNRGQADYELTLIFEAACERESESKQKQTAPKAAWIFHCLNKLPL